MANAGGTLVIKKKGAAEVVFGAVFLLLPLVLMRYRPVQVLRFSVVDYAIRLAFMLLFVGGIQMLYSGIRKRKLYQKLLRLQGLFDQSLRVPLEMAADLLKCSLTILVGDVRDMQKLGLTQGLYADLPRKELVCAPEKKANDWIVRGMQMVKDIVGMNDNAVSDPPPPPEIVEDSSGITLREEPRKSVKPIYMFGVFWAAYALFFPFYRPLDLVIALILGLIAFLHASWNTPARTVIIEVLPVIAKPVQTGNESLDQMLSGVHIHMETLRTLEKTIGGKLDEPVRDILRTSEQIIEQVKKNPGKTGEMRQFFNYTLPTTIGLLENYQELRAQPVQGGNIAAALAKIEGMTCTMVEAFHRQLDALFADKALDIAVELEVMNQMLRGSGDIKGTFNDFSGASN